MKPAVSVLLVLSGLVFVGCQAFQKRSTTVEPTPEERSAWRSELEQAWVDVNEGSFEKGLREFREFRQKHPQTIFDSEAMLGEAQALGGMGDWSGAGQIDRRIITDRLAKQPEVAVLAMYDLAFVAEALGDESQMLANLQDVEAHQDKLPDEVRLAALPARLAVAYTKVSQPREARAARERAEAGITQLKAQNLPAGKWAELYFAMGSISTNQLAPENFQTNLDSFAGAQIFLLKAIETGVEPWSQRALRATQEHYRDFWNLAMNPPVARGLDAGAMERSRAEQQAALLGEIGKLLAILKQNYKPEELPLSEDEKKFRQFIENLSAQTEARQLEAAAVLPLTPEARKRQNLRRAGTIWSEPLFPSEKRNAKKVEPVTGPVKTKEDPNLKNGDGK